MLFGVVAQILQAERATKVFSARKAAENLLFRAIPHALAATGAVETPRALLVIVTSLPA